MGLLVILILEEIYKNEIKISTYNKWQKLCHLI